MSDLAGDSVPISAQIAEVERELGMRESVYPRRVAAGAMSLRTADQQMMAMRAVLATLQLVNGGKA